MGVVRRLLVALGLKKAKLRLLVVGLDNSGKTTLVHSLRASANEAKGTAAQTPGEIAPTPGFSVEKFELGKSKLAVVDMSGQRLYHKLWTAYYNETDAVLFVVDAADHTRFEEAHGALKSVASGLPNKLPILVCANKMDLMHAAAPADVASSLKLDTELGATRSWRIQSCSAAKREGVDDGVRWLLGVAKPK